MLKLKHNSRLITLGVLALVLALSLSTSQPVRADITNGGFESGDTSGWTVSTDTYTEVTVSSSEVHTGSYSARLSVSKRCNDARIERTLPSNATSLSFWSKSTNAVSSSSFYAVITDLSDDETYLVVSETTEEWGWTKTTYDLSEMAGHELKIRFTLGTWGLCAEVVDAEIFLDDISVNVVAAPEVSVEGNSTEIADGDSSPSTGDHTDFGSADMDSGTVVRTFTIRNTGSANLTLSGTPMIAVGGDNAADFTVTANATSPVAATTGSTTF